MELTAQKAANVSKEIYILGNGVIGKALAVALSIKGKKVTILRGTVDDEPAYSQNILVETADNTWEAEIRISTLSHHSELNGIILLTNKSFGNEGLAHKLTLKAKDSPIVFLQNGLNIENSFIELGFTSLYRCVLFATSQAITDNKVRFKPVSESPIGLITGSVDVLKNIVDELNTNIFPFRQETDIQPVIWKKVISNCVFNSICPLLETDNGIFHRNDAVLQIARTVITECIEVSKQNGIRLSITEVMESVLSISKMSDGQKISTYQDILGKRETEIETMNFAVVKAAGSSGKDRVPVTALLGELVKMKSTLSRH